MSIIDPSTSMGRVALTVADLDRSLAYYRHNIGLQVKRRENGTAVLGSGQHDLLILTEQPGARPTRGTTGLYHYALLVPSRHELARTLQHLIATQTRLGGASDHAVSEALYLTDPDGHGIEIYRDRAREEWQFPGGRLKMTVDPLDFDGLLSEAANASDWTGIHPQTRMGHFHLHVSEILAAEHFYRDILGFDIMARYGNAASFVAAGGYHHHLGLNTWAGVGAPPAPPDAARLLWYEIQLPDAAALNAVLTRLDEASVPWREDDEGIIVADPAQNTIRLRTPSAKPRQTRAAA